MLFFLASKKEQIRDLVNRIKSGDVKRKRNDSKKSGDAKIEKPKKVKEKKINIGWLHRSHPSKQHTQVRKTGGKTIRQIFYTNEDEITVDFLIAEGKRLFLTEMKEDIRRYGPIDKMEVELGNFNKNPISKFTDTDGNECSYAQYLRNRGLFPSRTNVYLLTTSSSVAESSSHGSKDDSLSLNRESNEAAVEVSSPSLPLMGVAGESEQFAVHGHLDQTILIEYEHVTESSYSEVFVKSLSHSRKQCYELTSFEDPTVQDTLLQDFEPLENGFRVVGISKPEPEHRTFIERIYDPSDVDNPSETFITPNAKDSAGSLILHHPSEIWGYDGSQLMLGVVSSCHHDPTTFYTWYHDDNILKSGPGLCCIAVNSPGKYSVKVQNTNGSALSKPVWARPLTPPEIKTGKANKK